MNGKSWILCVAFGSFAWVPWAFAAQDAVPPDQASHRTESSAPRTLGTIEVRGQRAFASDAQYHEKDVDLGPLGKRPIKDTPFSVTVVPEALIVNQQSRTVNEVLRNLPSVTIRDQQGLEVSRPASRGFVGTVTQNTRLDGFSIIGTTAIPAENLGGIQVLNGLAGSLYGPETPAGVFNYVLKRPTDTPLLRLVGSYDTHSIFTGQLDAGGRVGRDGQVGYRVNLVHGEGGGYVGGSNSNRTLLSGDFDFHLGPDTVLQVDAGHYRTKITGLPGSVVYDGVGTASTELPRAVDPTRKGVLSQPGAGTDLMTNTGLVKLKHDFGNGWDFEVGGLYQNAIRTLIGITNAFVDNDGNYEVTKNFNAIPHYTIASNLARLSGHFDTFGMANDFTLATNGYNNLRFSNFNSIATPLGSANLDQPVVFDAPPVPRTGGQYRSGSLVQQSVILGDTLHFNAQWAMQGVVSTSWIRTRSWSKTGTLTSEGSNRGLVSPTLSVIYTPGNAWTAYATWARSVEPGDSAPAGTANAHQFLSPYHDRQVELGAKYALSDRLLLSMDVFRMTRPLAQTDPLTNVFAVVGTQRNQGAEVFVQGAVGDQLSVLGGLSYVDARLVDTGDPSIEGKMVIGMPRVKTDLSVDYHPTFAPGFALTATVHAESRRAASNSNDSFAPAYATLDVGARYSMRMAAHFLTLRMQVTNATDRHYYSAIAGGNIVGSPGANTAYFAPPRTWLASLEFDL